MSLKPNGTASISCADFQEQLPDLFANSNGNTDDPALKAHLDTCENCSALVRDLKYIADQARMLLEPADEEPSDSVWSGLQMKLDAERGDTSLSLDPGPLPK
jgi:hypothetical protein